MCTFYSIWSFEKAEKASALKGGPYSLTSRTGLLFPIPLVCVDSKYWTSSFAVETDDTNSHFGLIKKTKLWRQNLYIWVKIGVVSEISSYTSSSMDLFL